MSKKKEQEVQAEAVENQEAVEATESQPEAAQEAPPVQEATPEPKFSRVEILSNAEAFGVRMEVLAGALKLADKEHLTRQEVLDAIKQFRERTV